jgi:hypothetical protein
MNVNEVSRVKVPEIAQILIPDTESRPAPTVAHLFFDSKEGRAAFYRAAKEGWIGLKCNVLRNGLEVKVRESLNVLTVLREALGWELVNKKVTYQEC